MLSELIKADDTDYIYQNETRKMKIRKVDFSNDTYLHLLVSAGDKDVPDTVVENFNNSEIRTLAKKDEEGAVLTSHIIIRKTPDTDGTHLMLIEKVSGVNGNQLERFLTHLFKSDAISLKTFEKEGEEKEHRPLFEILGYKSHTLREAITSGKLEDIELVSKNDVETGFDEDGYIVEENSNVEIKIGKPIAPEKVDSLFSNIFERHPKPDVDQMYVRVKTPNDQIKTTEIDLEKEDILSQFFIHNEKIVGFGDNPLTNACEEIRADIIQKLHNVANKY